ncbi:hypothetical protein SNEBB_003266 [Seison nebaliae]|nr:hypothetical protein SNEBB_003266 [Seison nebaliae]
MGDCLTPNEKLLISDQLSDEEKILCFSVCRLFNSSTSSNKWKKPNVGVLTLIRHTSINILTYYIYFFSTDLSIKLKQEVYYPFTFSTYSNNFCQFFSDTNTVGIQFHCNDESKIFSRFVDRISRHRDMNNNKFLTTTRRSKTISTQRSSLFDDRITTNERILSRDSLYHSVRKKLQRRSSTLQLEIRNIMNLTPPEEDEKKTRRKSKINKSDIQSMILDEEKTDNILKGRTYHDINSREMTRPATLPRRMSVVEEVASKELAKKTRPLFLNQRLEKKLMAAHNNYALEGHDDDWSDDDESYGKLI